MVIDIKKYLAAQVDTEEVCYSFTIDDVGVDGGKLFRKPVDVKAVFTSFSGSVKLQLGLTAEMTVRCDRCSKQFIYPIDLVLNHVLVPELSNEDDEGEMIEVDVANFNLDELAYSDIMLSMPTKILCRDDCRGICPQCGKELNEGDCDCDKRKIDPRLEALQQLLDS